MEAAVEEKEEERGQLILELNELQQGGPRKTYDLTEEEQVQMKDILRVRVSAQSASYLFFHTAKDTHRNFKQ